MIRYLRYNCSLQVHREMSFTQRGFTLIELMITTAIIGVVASIAIPAYQDYVEKTKIALAIIDIRNISRSLQDHSSLNNNYPSTLAEINADTIIDPWKNSYQYLNLSDPNIKGVKGKARKDHNLVPINSDFDLYSMGKDGKSTSPLTAKASQDDVIRASDGRFIGLASKY